MPKPINPNFSRQAAENAKFINGKKRIGSVKFVDPFVFGDTLVTGNRRHYDRISGLPAENRKTENDAIAWGELIMSTVEHIEDEVRNMSPEELIRFRKWFLEFDARQWDEQIAQDAQAGKLDKIADSGRSE